MPLGGAGEGGLPVAPSYWRRRMRGAKAAAGAGARCAARLATPRSGMAPTRRAAEFLLRRRHAGRQHQQSL
jgi:hypothetical protein